MSEAEAARAALRERLREEARAQGHDPERVDEIAAVLAEERLDRIRRGYRESDLAWEAPLAGPVCPHCGRVMSDREKAEQGACNDCHGGAWTSEAS